MKSYPTGAGIYKLTCVKNGKVYIGKSVNIYFRLSYHKSCEKKSKGRGYFENSIIKYGWDYFNIEILETVDNFDKLKDNVALLEREAYYIKLFDSTNTSKGYNICSYSTDRTGIPNSEETRKNISQGQLGRKLSEETKEKIRQSRLGKAGTPHSEATKEHLRQINTGKKLSEEQKSKLRQFRLGTKHSEETKLKLSLARIGNSNARGFKHSEETKEKCRLGKLKSKQSTTELDALIDVSLLNVADKNLEVSV